MTDEAKEEGEVFATSPTTSDPVAITATETSVSATIDPAAEPAAVTEPVATPKETLVQKLDAFLDKAECAAERDAKSILAFIEKHI